MTIREDMHITDMRTLLVAIVGLAFLSIAARAQSPSAETAGGQPSADSTPTTSETEQQALAEDEAVSERVEGDRIITEYRRRGHLYMVKVKPINGPAQYWYDRDGDGQFQPDDTGIDEDVNLPKWRIGTW